MTSGKAGGLLGDSISPEGQEIVASLKHIEVKK